MTRSEILGMNPPWKVRPIEAGDQAFLWEMLYLALWDAPDEPRRPRSVLDDPRIRRLVEAWGREEDLGLMALDPVSGQEVGAIWARLQGYDQIDGHDCPYPFVGMAVIEPCQRKGIGSLLMARFIAEARKRCTGLRLGVNPQNRAAIALYRKFGFADYAMGKGGYPQMKLEFSSHE